MQHKNYIPFSAKENFRKIKQKPMEFHEKNASESSSFFYAQVQTGQNLIFFSSMKTFQQMYAPLISKEAMWQLVALGRSFRFMKCYYTIKICNDSLKTFPKYLSIYICRNQEKFLKIQDSYFRNWLLNLVSKIFDPN